MNLRSRSLRVAKLVSSLVRKPIRTITVLRKRAKTKPIRRQLSLIDEEINQKLGELALVRRTLHRKKVAFERYQNEVLEPEQRERKKVQVDEHSRKIILSGQLKYIREKKITAELEELRRRKNLLIKQSRKKKSD